MRRPFRPQRRGIGRRGPPPLLSFADPETRTSEAHFIKCSCRLAPENLKMMHRVYRQVVHNEVSAKRTSDGLDYLLNSKRIYPVWTRCAIFFWFSAVIDLSSSIWKGLVDMFITEFGALFSAVKVVYALIYTLFPDSSWP
ncbi:hypothetical protein DFH94DRAFT_100992 [Russula ochroleuca]|uniref:Uncharacterized protein n=1 Tax=Russula ochroleuca TaxID=152965 RepID=A0A9P5MS42_9AGAM|nr:hypothetical protein DFH94DRAFT_100992 [Russula ochroleuca]